MNKNKTSNNRKVIPVSHVRQTETGIDGTTFRGSQRERDQKVHYQFKTGKLEQDYQIAQKDKSTLLARFDPFALSKGFVIPAELVNVIYKFELLEYGFLIFSHKSRTLMPAMMQAKHAEDRLQSIKACWRQETLNAGSVFACKQDLQDYLTCEFFFLSLWNFVPKNYSVYWSRSNKYYSADGSLSSLTKEEFEACKKAGLGD